MYSFLGFQLQLPLTPPTPLFKTNPVVAKSDKVIDNDDDTPIFIPSVIGTGINTDTEINIENVESDSSVLDDAAEILRQMKQKKKENPDER